MDEPSLLYEAGYLADVLDVSNNCLLIDIITCVNNFKDELQILLISDS